MTIHPFAMLGGMLAVLGLAGCGGSDQGASSSSTGGSGNGNGSGARAFAAAVEDSSSSGTATALVRTVALAPGRFLSVEHVNPTPQTSALRLSWLESGEITRVLHYPLQDSDRLVTVVPDGDSVIAAFGAGDQRVGLVRFDSAGAVAYAKTYETATPACIACPIPFALSQVVDGELVLARMGDVIRITAATGEVVFGKTLDTYNYVTQAAALTSSGIVLLGPASAGLLLTQLDATGDPKLMKSIELPGGSNLAGPQRQYTTTSLYANADDTLTVGYFIHDNYAQESFVVGQLSSKGDLSAATAYLRVDKGMATFGEHIQAKIYDLSLVRVDRIYPTPQGSFISDAYASDPSTNDGLSFLMELKPSGELQSARLLQNPHQNARGAVDAQGTYARFGTGIAGVLGSARDSFGCQPNATLVQTEALAKVSGMDNSLPQATDITVEATDYELAAPQELTAKVSELSLGCRSRGP